MRTSPRKIRNIRDELAYRDFSKDDDWCRGQLSSILRTAERVSDGNFVTFEIDDGLIRDYARKLVRDNYNGVFESGMNSTVVKISGKTFATLAIEILPEDQCEILLQQIPNDVKQENESSDQPKTLTRLFLDSFVTAAGDSGQPRLIGPI